MKYQQLIDLINEEEISTYILMPGIIESGNIPITCELPISKDLTLNLVNSIANTLTNSGLEVDDFEFQVAHSGNDLILLLAPTYPKTVH